MAATSGASERVEHEIEITRVFDAPRELVFRAWTESGHLVRWFGPRSCKMPFCKMDARPGGVFHFCHRLPDGRDLWVKGAFREVVVPERLVFILSFVDKEGNPGRHPEFSDWPLDALFVTTVTFAEHEGRTKLTVHQVVTSATPSTRNTIGIERNMAQQGWAESLDRLAELVRA
jgi:uncharacterized protein YndB with AHSA1/START domain